MRKIIGLFLIPISIFATTNKNLTLSQMEKNSDMILEGEILKVGRYKDGTYDITFDLEDNTTKILKGKDRLNSKYIVGFHYYYKGKDAIPFHKIERKHKIMRYYLKKIKTKDTPLFGEFVLYDDKLGVQELIKH
jgi:hypothetical protein